MRRLERYLKDATAGLYGQKRAQVVRELRGNLLARAREFRLSGLDEAAALERSLDEFGAAQVVARGMREVHTMPLVMKSGAGLALMLGLGAALWSGSSSAVNVLSEIPAQVCEEFKDSFECKNNREFASSWIELESLRTELSAQGVRSTVSTVPDRKAVIFEFPGNDMVYVPLQNRVCVNCNVITGFSYGGKDYFQLSTLIASLNTAKVLYAFAGQDTSLLNIGKISINLKQTTLVQNALLQTDLTR